MSSARRCAVTTMVSSSVSLMLAASDALSALAMPPLDISTAAVIPNPVASRIVGSLFLYRVLVAATVWTTSTRRSKCHTLTPVNGEMTTFFYHTRRKGDCGAGSGLALDCLQYYSLS